MAKIILIIEEDAFVSANFKELCDMESFICIQAASFEAGIRAAKEADLILCDLHINGWSGFNFYQMLQKNPVTAGIPFYFLTDLTDSATINRINSLNAKYIIKPFKIKEIIDILQQC